MSCLYAWPHTRRLVMGMPIMPLRSMYVLKLLYATNVLGLWFVHGFNFVDGYIKGQVLPFLSVFMEFIC
jgi:hypothetical protein